MSHDEPIELLQAHEHKLLRTFLAQAISDKRIDELRPAEQALWDLMLGDCQISHETALAVVAECERVDRRVADVLEGWRPHALLEAIAADKYGVTA